MMVTIMIMINIMIISITISLIAMKMIVSVSQKMMMTPTTNMESMILPYQSLPEKSWNWLYIYRGAGRRRGLCGVYVVILLPHQAHVFVSYNKYYIKK